MSDDLDALLHDEQLREVLTESRDLGFLGPGPVMFHVEHAAVFLSALGSHSEFLDLGSGGGVPGLILARARPTSHGVLLDAMERRCRFLERAIELLGLSDRLSVVCGRAEELGHRDDLRGRFQVVVTRSFGRPAVTAECAVGFLDAPGGRILVSEPPIPPKDRWPEEGLSALGLRLGDQVRTDASAVQVLEAVAPPDDRFPRRTGLPAKRPLF